MARDAVLEGEVGGHDVPSQQPQALVAFHGVVDRHVAAALGHVAEAPRGVGARDVPHALHHVAAQHEQVLAARPPVALPAASHHLQVADGAAVDQPLDVVFVGVRAVMRDRDARPGPVAGLQHRVGRGRRRRERLLAEDALRARLGGRDHHLLVAVGPPRAHGHEVEAAPCPASRGSRRTGRARRCVRRPTVRRPTGSSSASAATSTPGTSDERDVEAVAVVAAARPPDDAGTVACHILRPSSARVVHQVD